MDELTIANGSVTTLYCTSDIHHPKFGKLQLDYSSFAVEGRSDLIMVVYNPATLKDQEIIRKTLLAIE